MDEDKLQAYQLALSGHNLLILGQAGTGRTFLFLLFVFSFSIVELFPWCGIFCPSFNNYSYFTPISFVWSSCFIYLIYVYWCPTRFQYQMMFMQFTTNFDRGRFQNYRRRENSAESRKAPSGFSVKPWQGVEVEAPKHIFDLVNFHLLLRGFPSFKMVSFCFNLH